MYEISEYRVITQGIYDSLQIALERGKISLDQFIFIGPEANLIITTDELLNNKAGYKRYDLLGTVEEKVR